MSLPAITTREQWLAARKDLLVQEKELTRQRDALNARRRMLPMVRIGKEYTFSGPGGRPAGLRDLFGPYRQLMIQHVMFGPDWEEPCPSCAAALDELSAPLLAHLQARDTTFVAVSRAPIARIDDYRAKRGWEFPWYSSCGSTFNYDFHVSLDASVAPVMFNYRNPEELKEAGFGWIFDGPSEQPGMSCFLRDGDEIFHTYSTFGRGMEQTGGPYALLDMTALGRQEDWEEPRDRVAAARPAIPDFTA